MKKRNEESAFSAICNAQRIACAPFEFEAARSLRDFGILAALDKAGDAGVRSNVTHQNRLFSPE